MPGTPENILRISAGKTIRTISIRSPGALVNEIRMVPGLNTGVTLAAGGSTTAEAPLIVIDGVQQTMGSGDETSFLMTVDPYNIAFVEVLKGPQAAIYGIQGAGGVILVYSKNSNKGSSAINSQGLATISPKGYAPQSEFPVPDPGKKETAPATPDPRATVFWKGYVPTDAQEKASVEFYAPEPSKRSYRVCLVGVTATGELIWKELRISRS
jgi:hypothetical protein